MKRLIKLANFLDGTITEIALHIGLILLAVLGIVAFAYITQGVTPLSLDLSSFISGPKAYLWIALPLLWLAPKGLLWGLKFRNWWVHNESHKIEIRQLLAFRR